MSIGENIKKLRGINSLTQKEFAKIAGVSDKAVSTWENGIKDPRMGAIQKIADYFGLQKSNIIEENGLNLFFDNRNEKYGQSLPLTADVKKLIKYYQLCEDESKFTEEEIKLINDYRTLGRRGKKTVDKTISYELKQSKKGGYSTSSRDSEFSEIG